MVLQAVVVYRVVNRKSFQKSFGIKGLDHLSTNSSPSRDFLTGNRDILE